MGGEEGGCGLHSAPVVGERRDNEGGREESDEGQVERDPFLAEEYCMFAC